MISIIWAGTSLSPFLYRADFLYRAVLTVPIYRLEIEKE